MKTKFLFGCILLFCCLAPDLRAQDTEFWFVAPNIVHTTSGIYPMYIPTFLAVSNTTGQEAHIVIKLYNGGNPLTIPETVAPGSLFKYDFTSDSEIATIENPSSMAGSVVTFGVHITSDVKVAAYYMVNAVPFRDIFTMKGHQALGTHFYVPMQSDNAATTAYGALDQIDIVATEDGTVVTVTPTAPIVNTDPNDPNPIPAGYTLSRTLSKGQTLKIMEQTPNVGSLTGTEINATKPIAVTVTEDGTKGDTSGDQIVPVNSLGSRYIVPKGYRTNTPTDRIYLVGAEDGTTVNIYTATGSTPAATITLNAGTAGSYYFPSAVNVLYAEAEQPFYVYHRSGYGEEGASLLPSLYAIGQKQLSYYQISGVSIQKGFLVFRSGTQGGFRISYGTVNNAVLNVNAPYEVPNMPDWKVARFDLPSNANGRVVTIRNEQSPFAFGYITGEVTNNDSYGYFSAYSFELPDTTYMCTTNPSVTLEGGYAMSHTWTYNGSVISTNQNITVTQEGEYTLEMNQDPTIVTVTTFVKMINAGTICPDTVICTGTNALLSVSGASGDKFQWQSSPNNATWADIAGATSPTYTTGALTQPIWYRRKTGANDCQMLESGSVRVGISPCVLPVNPHLMGRFRGN
jgi:hypothetical protein